MNSPNVIWIVSSFYFFTGQNLLFFWSKLFTLRVDFLPKVLCVHKKSRKHAYIILTPLNPTFYIVRLGFTGVYIIYLISVKNIDCWYSFEPPRRSGSNEYHNLCLEQKYEKYRDRRDSSGDEREGQGSKRNESEETEEIKTPPSTPDLLQGKQALPSCKPISIGRPGDVRYTTSSPHPTSPWTKHIFVIWSCMQIKGELSCE